MSDSARKRVLADWVVKTKNLLTGDIEELFFDALILCTGVSSIQQQ